MKIIFSPSTVAKSAEVNQNFAGTWDGTLMDDESIGWQHLAITGAVIDYPSNSIPSGWLLCDGSSKLRATYPALFAKIGTLHGFADEDHFNLPDRRSRVPVGLDAANEEFDTIGKTGGEIYHQLLEDEMPSHAHDIATPVQVNDNDRGGSSSLFSLTDINFGNTDFAGGDAPHNNLPPYQVTNFIIKT